MKRMMFVCLCNRGAVLPRLVILLSLTALSISMTAGISQNANRVKGRISSLDTRHSTLVVHEWGTFVSMEGSDGVVLDGLHHEEADLPSFVYSRSRDQIRHLPAPPSKLETPVIYFYAPGPMKVDVRVDFPQGVLTQWFPDVSMSGPRMQQTDLKLKDGMLQWKSVSLQSASLGPRRIQPVYDGNHYAEARAVDADYVTSEDQTERFLFYRGLGTMDPLLRAQVETAQRDSDSTAVQLRNTGQHALTHLFVMEVDPNKGSSYKYIARLNAGEQMQVRIPRPARSQSPEDFDQEIGDDLASRLTQTGLFPKESRAMVNTWTRSYFHTPGVRVLYIVPQTIIDDVLPLTINPRPADLVRVIVGRVECLTKARERAAESAVGNLASPDERVRNEAFSYLLSMGRFAEPILRRVCETTNDNELRERCQRIIHVESLDAIRLAARLPVPDPLSMQARLASTYRKLGMKEEATRIGESVLERLKETPEPRDDQHVEQRRYLRALSLAYDAVGDDRKSLEVLVKNIRFAARINEQVCQNCHTTTNAPVHRMADLRDWWGRTKFIELTKRLNVAEPIRKDSLQKIIRTAGAVKDPRNLTPDDKATRLIYLYASDASGREEAVVSPEALWKWLLMLDSPKTKTVAAISDTTEK